MTTIKNKIKDAKRKIAAMRLIWNGKPVIYGATISGCSMTEMAAFDCLILPNEPTLISGAKR